MFIWRKNNVSFSRYLNFQIYGSAASSEALLHNRSYTYACFFWMLSTIKMKFVQSLVCCMTNVSNIFLAKCWRLEISSRLFYNFIRINYNEELFFIHLFKKMKQWNLFFFVIFISFFTNCVAISKLNICLIKSSENTHVWLQFVAYILLWNFK